MVDGRSFGALPYWPHFGRPERQGPFQTEAEALSTLSNVICRLERHVALQGLRFPDGFGHSYVIPGRAYASFNPETLVWLDEMVGPENYVIFADIFGISFWYEQDAFAFRLRWS